MKWTKNKIPDLRNKVAVVTGGNRGLGFQSVKLLVAAGATVVVACRNVSKGEEVAERLKALSGHVVPLPLDLEDVDSIKTFATLFQEQFSSLDILINNAGIMATPYALAPCGVERQLAVNHLGHFLLVYYLLRILSSTPGSRVVSMSSLAHRKGDFDFSDINYDKGNLYEPMEAYRRSKLANLLFTYGLDSFFKNSDIQTLALAAHPGVVPTDILNHRIPVFFQILLRPVFSLFLQSPSMGALAAVRAAVDPVAASGEFYGPRWCNGWMGLPVLVQSEGDKTRHETIQKLWSFSEDVTGIKYSDFVDNR